MKITKTEVIDAVCDVLSERGKEFDLDGFQCGTTIYYLRSERCPDVCRIHTLLKFVDEMTDAYGDHFQAIEQKIIQSWLDGVISVIEKNRYFDIKDVREYERAVRKVLLENRILFSRFRRASQSSALYKNSRLGKRSISLINDLLSCIKINLGIPNNPLTKCTKTPSLHEKLRMYRFDIGGVLRDFREERNLKLKDAAASIGVGLKFLSEIELGDVRYIDRHVEKILSGYDITDAQYRFVMELVKRYRIAYVRSAIDDNRKISIKYFGDYFPEYIDLTRKIIQDNGYTSTDILPSKNAILEGRYRADSIKATIIDDINSRLRILNLLPKHDNYLFAV